ncbi:ABC transporter permease [Ignisphaera sp. 4213-co]|uniref:ABC transporter permease n=1 Tax=Ignisphaera cupida TaxID=3050454 RepID=A0ABD4Z5P0_9CREN|nr:ABC transporter permease [Ignisphaera sp. 4213-co]MDK6028434.1 ABC transporter permease [Ignisphaera sp. 4213-co]
MLKAIESILAMAEMELRRLKHDPIEIITRAVQPILWVTVFGVVMAHRIMVNVEDYISFIAPGVVLQSATFIALAYGIMLVFERESGILKKLLSSPIPRTSIVIGRALAGGIRASTQYIIVLASAALVGARFTNNLLLLITGYLVVTYVCMGFTAISILVASLMKTRERFMGIVGAISMPLFFASNALYPLDIMPESIKLFALVNPITYTVDLLRALLLNSSINAFNDVAIITLFNIIAFLLAIKIINKIIE